MKKNQKSVQVFIVLLTFNTTRNILVSQKT